MTDTPSQTEQIFAQRLADANKLIDKLAEANREAHALKYRVFVDEVGDANITKSVEKIVPIIHEIIYHLEGVRSSTDKLIAQGTKIPSVSTDDDRPIKVDDIIEVTAAHYRVPLDEIRRAGKPGDVRLPRKVAIYVSRQLTDLSFPNLTWLFEGEDHLAMRSAEKYIGGLLNEDKQLFRDVVAITAKVQRGELGDE